MGYKVFIDGGHGTTGLKIHERLDQRDDIEILRIDEAHRKDLDARIEMTKQADISILCLPDAASQELAQAAPPDVRLIDTSTAHRTNPDWVYGMPELAPGQREKIRNAARVANPGCHATGFILLVRPLVDAGILPPDYPLDAFCITGYSGGGKKMIQNHEKADREAYLSSPGQYGLTQKHKHLPEMVMMTGISQAPAFSPIVGDFYSGMVMTVPLHTGMLHGSPGPEEIRQVYRERYGEEKLIRVMDKDPEDGFIHSNVMAGSDEFQIFVTGNEERVLLLSRFDNLGKGASGQAVQNMNIMLGIEETKGV
ncbi:N-acetyl-gamma-glutamyl-phosphate reductase [Eubacterium pyruvativorans]|uniref:N-acetyl-gamma-glutamyl-phosphate reductase n=1 Tax=Eubacterium pyruvativorans TaxID=155865 RepID=UPI0023EFFE51|nr:N-acetyl-gamma-glutamyl-phosphate reductase [Eubacterium pyruvativorans]MCI5747712.1 N-acetyl-gamma-glutamyl-phosphate reductase [Eubacterium pyruvativorans]MDD7684424.1 N-acetyl-gamma-glutamyl-phosphate reductase [Eubacterium pyruvativorans]